MKIAPAELIRRLEAAGISRESLLAATRDDVLAWVELHIEQGTRLEDAGVDIGVVNAIVGIRSIHVEFRGEAAHAGTKPMDLRRDALWGAATFALRARDLVMRNVQPGRLQCREDQRQAGRLQHRAGRGLLRAGIPARLRGGNGRDASRLDLRLAGSMRGRI